MANYRAIPSANTKLTRFDTLIVLGTPCTAEGTSSPEQRERVLEGVREFRAGVAKHMIVTGGAAHNQFYEADCMRRSRLKQGVPAGCGGRGAAGAGHDSEHLVQQADYGCAWMAVGGGGQLAVASAADGADPGALQGQGCVCVEDASGAVAAEFTREQIVQHYAGEMKGCWRLTHQGFPKNRWLPGS